MWLKPTRPIKNVMVFSNPGLWSFGLSGQSLWFRLNGYDYTISDSIQRAGLRCTW